MRRALRILSIMLCLCLLSMLLSGCGKKQGEAPTEAVTSIYTSFYPLYAAAEWLLAGIPNVELNCLVQPQDGCLRNYQLSDWDLALLSSADLILAGGRGLESFESVLYALGENGPAVSAILYNMELTEQRGRNTQEDTQSHWLDANPHIYMETAGMIEIVQRVANTLILFDPAHEDIYRKNLENTLSELNALHDEISAGLSHLKDNQVIVMNEALVYAVREYGLKAAMFYDRESGAGMYDDDLQECLKMLGKSGAQVILIEKQAPQSLCEVLEATGYRLARMDILSTRRASEGAEGYFDAQRANVQAVKDAFGE